MDKISTPTSQAIIGNKPLKAESPRFSTIDFIKQFARSYMPIAKMPGLALN